MRTVTKWVVVEEQSTHRRAVATYDDEDDARRDAQTRTGGRFRYTVEQVQGFEPDGESE